MKAPNRNVLVLLGLLILAGCSDDPIPKPRGYFRIDLPEDRTMVQKSPCPFSAEVPVYAQLRPVKETGPVDPRVCWTDLDFPEQRAEVHMTYRRIDGDLRELIEDAHAFKSEHEAKAVRIRSEHVLQSDARVFGTLFNVDGDVASPMVFYLTDSVSNFLYGALYFDVRPNADSLAPVTDRIRADIRHFARTLHWENATGVMQDVQQR